MFKTLIEVLKKDGFGVHGFHKCASLALECGSKNTEAAAPFLLLSIAAEHFANLYDGQALPTPVAEEEFKRFESHVLKLEEAFSIEDESRRLAAINSVATKIIANKYA